MKTIFITGSSRGIGLAIAYKFLSSGYNVIINSSNKENLDKALDEIRSNPLINGALETIDRDYRKEVHIDGFVCDISNEKELSSVYKQIHSKYKKLDVLVNNAGILGDARLGMISSNMIDRVLDVNVKGTIYNIQLAQKLMKDGGSIINIGSIIGTNGNEGQVVYAASKSAVLGITKSAAKELAKKNIRVNCVCPGFIETSMTAGLSPEIYKERMDSIKMGRIGSVTEIANAVYFLGSSESSYITGQVLGVDGGMLI